MLVKVFGMSVTYGRFCHQHNVCTNITVALCDFNFNNRVVMKSADQRSPVFMSMGSVKRFIGLPVFDCVRSKRSFKKQINCF